MKSSLIQNIPQVLTLFLGLLLLTMEHTRAQSTSPSHGVWTESLFFRGFAPSTGEKLRMKNLVKLAQDAKSNQIRDLYIFAGPFNEDGSIPDYSFSQTARASVRRLKELAPNARVLPWLGGLQDKTVFLHKPEWRARAIEDMTRLAKFLEVPGVHLDFEYILPTSTYVIQNSQIPATRSPMTIYHPSMRDFFKEVQSKVPTLFVSTVFPSSAPEVTPWKANPSRRDLEEISPFVHQMSLLYYDTSITSQAVFDQGLRHQLEDIIAAKKASPSTEVNIAFGTFINEKPLHPYRDLSIENLPNSFATLQRVLQELGGKNPLSGISIFCEWETDESEWQQFREGTSLVAPFSVAGR